MSTTTGRTSKHWPLLAAVGVLTVAGGSAAAEILAAAQPAFAECAAARCLAVEPSAELLEHLSAGNPVDLDGLARNLQVRHEGNEPVVVQLVAARYQNGRLLRYRVSERLEVTAEGEAAPLEGGHAALQEALRSATGPEARVGPFPNGGVAIARVALERIVGNLPSTYLIGDEDAPGFLADVDLDEETLSASLRGALGVAVLLPERSDLRAEEETRSYALLVALDRAAGGN